MKINFGVFKADIIMTKHGPKVLEVTPRLSGGFDSQKTTPLSSGRNFIGVAMKQSIGLSLDKKQLKHKWKKFSAVWSVIPEPGKIKKIVGLNKAKKMKGVCELVVLKRAGERIQKITNSSLRPLYVIAIGKTYDEALLNAQPGVRASWGKSFHIYVKDNILVTQRILEFAKTCNMKKIVIASSSSVYGNQFGKMNEKLTHTQPVSPYGVTKLAAEKLGILYHKNFNLPIVALRYFTVYGPRQRPDMAFFKFISANINNKKIQVFGNGDQRRDFTYVSDIVDATINASKSKFSGDVFNIGGGKVYSINEVLKKIENLCGQENKIEFQEEQKGDVIQTEADIASASKELDYKPTISLDEGLLSEINWIKKEI